MERLEICQQCPIYIAEKGLCSPTLYLNPSTGETSDHYKPGFEHGCGCYIPTKVKNENNHCPLKKW